MSFSRRYIAARTTHIEWAGTHDLPRNSATSVANLYQHPTLWDRLIGIFR